VDRRFFAGVESEYSSNISCIFASDIMKMFADIGRTS